MEGRHGKSRNLGRFRLGFLFATAIQRPPIGSQHIRTGWDSQASPAFGLPCLIERQSHPIVEAVGHVDLDITPKGFCAPRNSRLVFLDHLGSLQEYLSFLDQLRSARSASKTPCLDYCLRRFCWFFIPFRSSLKQKIMCVECGSIDVTWCDYQPHLSHFSTIGPLDHGEPCGSQQFGAWPNRSPFLGRGVCLGPALRSGDGLGQSPHLAAGGPGRGRLPGVGSPSAAQSSGGGRPETDLSATAGGAQEYGTLGTAETLYGGTGIFAGFCGGSKAFDLCGGCWGSAFGRPLWAFSRYSIGRVGSETLCKISSTTGSSLQSSCASRVFHWWRGTTPSLDLGRGAAAVCQRHSHGQLAEGHTRRTRPAVVGRSQGTTELGRSVATHQGPVKISLPLHWRLHRRPGGGDAAPCVGAANYHGVPVASDTSQQGRTLKHQDLRSPMHVGATVLLQYRHTDLHLPKA